MGMVRRNFRRLDKEDFLLIYKTYIRPHMQYCVVLKERHRVLGKGSKISNKDGAWASSLVL